MACLRVTRIAGVPQWVRVLIRPRIGETRRRAPEVSRTGGQGLRVGTANPKTESKTRSLTCPDPICSSSTPTPCFPLHKRLLLLDQVAFRQQYAQLIARPGKPLSAIVRLPDEQRAAAAP